jgi:uncharacterized membrane protein YccC
MIAGMRVTKPWVFALEDAVRAAIVSPAAFAISLEVVGSREMALFAALGSMALLVFVEFAGSRRARLRAYLALLAAGAGLIALGTVCSRAPWAATVAMAAVAFTILFAGVLGDYIAAAHSGAMLMFVLPVMVPADIDQLPMRLAGWGLAGGMSIGALLLLWPHRPRGAMRRTAACAAQALAQAIQAKAQGQEAALASAWEAAHEAILALRRDFLSLAHRPCGTASRTAALGRLKDDLGWLQASTRRAPAARSRAQARSRFEAERAEIEKDAPYALRAVAARLALGDEPGGEQARMALHALQRIQRAHAGMREAIVLRAEGWRAGRDEIEATRELDEAYRLRQISFATIAVCRDALLACGETVADDPLGTRRARISATGRAVRTHASRRSVLLRNSVRGATGLALAVLIGQLSDLQHAFWIVLGTMTVLRSSALSTSTTIAWALLGTFGGILVGGLLIAVVGDSQAALWVILPFAVALAAYAPREISFAAGQGAFSLVVLVLFNLIVPEGWKVGIVRVEDVAIGAGVSLLAGVLIWPRGATEVMREALGTTYVRIAGYLEATIDALLDDRHDAEELAAQEATEAIGLLDASVRDFLSQRSSARASLDDLTVLVSSANRVRTVVQLLLQAQAAVRLAPLRAAAGRLAAARDAFESERRAICRWYAELGEAIAHGQTPPAPEIGEAVRTAGGTADRVGEMSPPVTTDDPLDLVALERPGGSPELPPGLAIAWAHRHMRSLAELEPVLAAAGARIAGRS